MKRTAKTLSALTVCLLLAATAFAQDDSAAQGGATDSAAASGAPASVTLSLEDAVQSALDNNISLKQSAISLDAAERAKRYSWNSVSPTLGLNGSYSLGAPPANEGQWENLSLGATASIGLTPSIYTSVKGATNSYEQQQLSYDNDVRTLELNVRRSYYQLLYQTQQIALQEQSVETSRRQYEQNLTRYNRGVLSRLDVLSAEVNLRNAELELQSLETALASNMATFKQTLGIPQETEVTLSGSFDSILALTGISLEGVEISSYSIRSLEAQIAGANNSLLASRFSAYGPSLNASYSYNFTEQNSGDWSNGGTLSVTASIPLDGLLPWSTGAQSIAAQRDNVATLELALEDARVSLDVSVASSLEQINQYMENIALRRSSIDLAQTTYDMTLDAYNHGTRDLLSLQSAEDDLTSARTALLSEAYNLVSAILDLENTIGVPFGTLGQ